jgi:hypothetical protein
VFLALSRKEKEMQSSRKLVALLAVVLAVLALGPAPAAQAGSAQIHVYPPQAHPYGHSYGEWLIRAVQWWLATPAPENAVYDHTGAHCAVGQSGPVWYLIGNEGGTDTRTCTVPPGKALLFAAALLEVSAGGDCGSTFAALRSCAKSGMDAVTQDGVTVDGVHLTNLLTRYRFQTPLFTLAYPADDIVGRSGPGTTKSMVDGTLVILAPLAAGRHTLDLRYSFGPPNPVAGEVTYHLTVRRSAA